MIILCLLGTLTVVAGSYPPDDQYGPPAETYGVPVKESHFTPRLTETPPPPIIPPLELLPIPSPILIENPGEVIDIVKKPVMDIHPPSVVQIEEVRLPHRPPVDFVQVPSLVIPPPPVLPPLDLPIKTIIEKNKMPPAVFNIKTPVPKSHTGREYSFRHNYGLDFIDQDVNSPTIEIEQPDVVLRPAPKVVKAPHVKEYNIHHNYATVIDNGLKVVRSEPTIEIQKPRPVVVQRETPLHIEIDQPSINLPSNHELFLSHKLSSTNANGRFKIISDRGIEIEEPKIITSHEPVVLKVGKQLASVPLAQELLLNRNIPFSKHLNGELKVVASEPHIEITEPRVYTRESPLILNVGNPSWSSVIDNNVNLISSPYVVGVEQPKITVPEYVDWIGKPVVSLVPDSLYRHVPASSIVGNEIKFLTPGTGLGIHAVANIPPANGITFVQSPHVVVDESESSPFLTKLKELKKSGLSFLQTILSR